MASIDAGEINLGRLFSADYEFTIPDYQRPYSWGPEEALQLLDDLETALDRQDNEPYFLGSLVLVKEKDNPASEVIDGQQRLTTLTILFACLRDLADDQSLSSDIHELIEEREVVWADQPAKPRLTLRDRDIKFFQDHIQTRGAVKGLVDLDHHSLANDAQRAIRDNAAALYSKLSERSDADRQKLFVMIAARTFLVVVATADLHSAYRIFSVMNSRGLPLTPPDIFKSQVIGAISGDDDRKSYGDRWEDLEESLGRDEFGDLFLYIRTIVAKARAVRGLLIEFPQQVLNEYLPGRARNFVDEVLEPYAQADLKIINHDFSPTGRWGEINQWLKWMNQLGNDDWRPPALWALRNYPNEPEFLAQFFKKLERLAASILVRRVYTTPRASRFIELLTQLDDGSGLDSPAFDLSEDERAQSRHALDGDLYLATAVRRYVLLRLDALLAKDPGATYDHKIITVEHVLPQTPQDDSDWVRNFTDEERETWTHRLGNLLLLNRRKNSEAQNYDFDVKKSKYFSGANGVAVFALTTQVLNQATWTPQTVQERQDELTKILFTEWELN